MGDVLSLSDYIRNGIKYDFPAGIPHGSWDFDEWPGVDHDKVYRINYPFDGVSNMKIDFIKTHFDKDDHIGYLKSPEDLNSRGFEDIEVFLKRSFGSKPAGEVTILTVTSHPDDESIDLGGIVGWAGTKGFKTVVISVTSGSNSLTLDKESGAVELEFNSFGIDNTGEFKMERDLYGVEREACFLRACNALGVTKGYLLPYPGGRLFGKKVKGFGEIAGIDYVKTFGVRGRFRKDLKNALKIALEEEKPDLLFTHGTNGGYGHPMHLITNELVTEVVKEINSKIYLFYSTPEMNVSDKITHYLYLRKEGVDFQSMKEKAYKAHSYIAKSDSNYDFPWDPVWNPEGVLMKDYGWTSDGYPPPYEFYSLQ